MKGERAQRKRHVIAIVREIDGPMSLTFCGRAPGEAEDLETQSEIVAKISNGLFRPELHCRLCLRAIELNELIYVHSDPPAALEAC
jgi:hypothetical protein